MAMADHGDTTREAPIPSPWVLVAMVLGSSIAFIDFTVVNVALPALQRGLGATVADAEWVVEAYALLLAALILAGGSLGDHYGRRRIYLLGVAGFAAASAGCGLAPSIGALIAWRAVQGAAAALLVPGGLAILAAVYPPDRRGRAIGTWSGATSITTAMGPLAGGWLIDHASWRWAFFLNLPLAAAVLLLTLRHVPESRDPDARRLDPVGVLLATLGLGGLTYGLTEAPRLGAAHPAVWGTLLAGAAALAGFLAVEARAHEPMMPLGLFRSRTFAGTNLLTFCLYGGLGGALFFLPFNLIQVQGYSATAAGATFLPLSLLLFLLSGRAGALADRRGARLLLVAGPAIAAAGLALLALPGVGGSYWLSYLPAVTVLGLGMAASVAPLTTAVMGAVEVSHAGLASGINNAVSRVASLMAIAILGLVVQLAFGISFEHRLDRLALPAAARTALAQQRDRMAAATLPAGLDPRQTHAARAALDGAFVDAFRVAMLCGAALALLAAACAAITLGAPPSPSAAAAAADPADPGTPGDRPPPA
jgi:EmrB/QacA subfamily drug resistance transporter